MTRPTTSPALFLWSTTWKESVDQQVPSLLNLGVHYGLGNPLPRKGQLTLDDDVIYEDVPASSEGLRCTFRTTTIHPDA